MIRPLRISHFFLFVMLLLIFPAMYFLTAFTGYRGHLKNPRVVYYIFRDEPPFKDIKFPLYVEAMKDMTVLVGKQSRQSKNIYLGVEIFDPLRHADILVYWTPKDSKHRGDFPANSIVVGELIGKGMRSFPVPEGGSFETGELTFYSLAHKEVLGAVSLD